MLFVEPETMFCDDITKVVMGSGINVFKVTGYLNKYVRFFITDEVDKCFATSCNSQVVLEILEILKKQVPQFI